MLSFIGNHWFCITFQENKTTFKGPIACQIFWLNFSLILTKSLIKILYAYLTVYFPEDSSFHITLSISPSQNVLPSNSISNCANNYFPNEQFSSPNERPIPTLIHLSIDDENSLLCLFFMIHPLTQCSDQSSVSLPSSTTLQLHTDLNPNFHPFRIHPPQAHT